MRLRKVGGSIFKTFDTDFGHYTKYNFTVGYGLGVETEASNFNFDIFPNPTDGQFTLNLDNFVGDEIKIEIHNSLGQLIKTEYKSNENIEGFYKLEIDLSNVEKGIYFVNVMSNNQTESRTVIVE